VVRALDRITEPVLRPIRRLLPPVRAGGMAIDLSLIIAILFLEIVVVNVIIPAL
jgi:YggT family protein